MLIFERTFDTPEENLAADETLLELAEVSDCGEILRFWESTVPFVALGYTNSIETETQRENCRSLNIPILRRVSGGGTVLQGPGSFNYALVLEIAAHAELQTVSESNAYIMARQRSALLQVLAGEMGNRIHVQGTTDLTLDNCKFSGNAQRRKRRFTLFHGTFLLDLPSELLAQTLQLPARQPEYRAHRTHTEFLTTLPLTRQKIKDALITEWNAHGHFEQFPDERMQKLLRERYLNPEWNLKF